MWLLRHGRTVYDRTERSSDDTRIYRPTPSSRRPQVVPSSALSSTQSVANSDCGSTQLLLPRRHSHHSHHHHRGRPSESGSGVSSTTSVAASDCGSTQLLLPGKTAPVHNYHRPTCRHYSESQKLTNMKELNLLLTAPHVPDLLTEKRKEDDVVKPAAPATEPEDAPSDHEEPQECRVPPINADLPFPAQPQRPIYIGTQVIAALSVSLGSMVVGFASGYTSPAVPSMEKTSQFGLTEQEKSWIGSLMPLAAMFGGIAGGPFIEGIGRRTTILATAVPFIVSWFLIALAQNVAMVLAGRAIAGFCVGVASLSLPVYLGETVQPEVRGTLGLLPTTFGNIGILLVFLAGRYMDWSTLAMLGGCLPVPFLICMFLIPETPRWYISKNKPRKARKALQWLRGKKTDISAEMNEIEKSASDSEKDQGDNSRCTELFKKQNLKPLLISIGLMFFQQMSGINAVIFYTTRIFQDAGVQSSALDESMCTIVVGIVNFFSTFVATILIDRLGRKILLYISSIFMTVSLAALSTYFFLKAASYEGIESCGWLPLASFVLYVVSFSVGLGPIPWLMMGEILPANIRGSAASVATAFNWSCTFIVTKTFSDLVQAVGMGGTFSIFGVICVLAFFFTLVCVPETQGQTLEDIEKKMTGRKVRRMSSIANLKPLPMGV